VELLVVVAIVGVIAALLMPALTASKAKAQGIYCLKNLKQVQMAWVMYADDHLDLLPGVIGGSSPGPGVWVSGWLDFSSNPDNTNTMYLTDRRFSQLAAYDVPARSYRCPADRSQVRMGEGVFSRVRSLSMNCWMNYIGTIPIGQDQFRVFRKLTDITEPPPAKAWVLMDEREDSINDGLFQTNLKGRGGAAKIVDYPASYHNRAAGIAFADGHGQIKKWIDRRTTPELRASQLIQLDVPSPDNPDVQWLQDRSSSLKVGFN
jgi:prepilin-type processing-associated H-X9-DG protein